MDEGEYNVDRDFEQDAPRQRHVSQGLLHPHKLYDYLKAAGTGSKLAMFAAKVCEVHLRQAGTVEVQCSLYCTICDNYLGPGNPSQTNKQHFVEGACKGLTKAGLQAWLDQQPQP